MKDNQTKHFKSNYYTACWCMGCKEVKVKCGNALLPFKNKQIKGFLDFLQGIYQQQFIEQGKDSIQFKFTEISFCFSIAELEDLTQLLSKIQVEIQRQQLEVLFHEKSPKLL